MNTVLLEQYTNQLKEDTAQYQRIRASYGLNGWCYTGNRPTYFYQPFTGQLTILTDDDLVISYIASLIESDECYFVGKIIDANWFRTFDESAEQYKTRVQFECSQRRRMKKKELSWIVTLDSLQTSIKMWKSKIAELYSQSK